MREFKNPFAYDKDNNIIYMETGNETKREFYKNCHCPICNEVLIPRMGQKNMWHFSHKSNSNCINGFETSLHLYGKHVIKCNTKIFLPKIDLGTALGMNMFAPELTKDILKWEWYNDLDVFYETVFNENTYDYKWISSEVKVNNFIPDVIIEIKGKKVAIEICVTHNVDDEKMKKVKLKDIDMLEIYLVPKEIDKRLKDESFNLDEYILFEAERKWIHKSSSIYFDEKIKKLIYNTRKPVINEKYTSKFWIEKSKHFLICPMCGGKLIERNGKNGHFFACSNYPKCRFTKNKLYDVGCPVCGKKLYVLDGKYGKYFGHLLNTFDMNRCTYTKPISDIENFLK